MGSERDMGSEKAEGLSGEASGQRGSGSLAGHGGLVPLPCQMDREPDVTQNHRAEVLRGPLA